MQVRTSFFEKKEAKKLLLMGPRARQPSGPSSKSFLVLIFKKELLLPPSLRAQRSNPSFAAIQDRVDKTGQTKSPFTRGPKDGLLRFARNDGGCAPQEL
jgi:hypothetical protein